GHSGDGQGGRRARSEPAEGVRAGRHHSQGRPGGQVAQRRPGGPHRHRRRQLLRLRLHGPRRGLAVHVRQAGPVRLPLHPAPLDEGGGEGHAVGPEARGRDRPPVPLAIHNESDLEAEPGTGEAVGRKAPWPIVAALVVAGVVVTPAAPAAPATGGTAVQMVDNEPDLTNWHFDPAALTVPAGSTVVWHNRGHEEHSVTADDRSFDSGLTKPGTDFQRTFPKVGVYAYHCQPHPWMTGKIQVVAADVAAASTTTATTALTTTTTVAAPAAPQAPGGSAA